MLFRRQDYSRQKIVNFETAKTGFPRSLPFSWYYHTIARNIEEWRCQIPPTLTFLLLHTLPNPLLISQ